MSIPGQKCSIPDPKMSISRHQKCKQINFGPIFNVFFEKCPPDTRSVTKSISDRFSNFFLKSVPRTPRSANKLISEPLFFLFYRDWTELTPRRYVKSYGNLFSARHSRI